MSYYECYEPILDRNLQELRKGSKNVNHLKKIKIFDADVLAEKLQRAYRYEPDFAIESVKFSYDGWATRSKYVQELWQKELLLTTILLLPVNLHTRAFIALPFTTAT